MIIEGFFIIIGIIYVLLFIMIFGNNLMGNVFCVMIFLIKLLVIFLLINGWFSKMLNCFFDNYCLLINCCNFFLWDKCWKFLFKFCMDVFFLFYIIFNILIIIIFIIK